MPKEAYRLYHYGLAKWFIITYYFQSIFDINALLLPHQAFLTVNMDYIDLTVTSAFWCYCEPLIWQGVIQFVALSE